MENQILYFQKRSMEIINFGLDFKILGKIIEKKKKYLPLILYYIIKINWSIIY